MNILLAENKICKIGTTPKVLYTVFKKESKKADFFIKNEVRGLIDNRFLEITPSGVKIKGWEGFVEWCEKRNLNVIKLAEDFVKIVKNMTL